MNSGSIFFWFKKEEMGSFCPKSPPPWLSLFLPLTVDSPVTFTGHPKMQKKWQCWDSCWFLTHCPSGYTGHVNTERPSSLQTETTEVRVFVKGTFGRSQECGAHSGFLDQISVYSFFKCFSTNTCPVWRLSEADVCSLAGSDVIFLFNYFEVRQVWRTNAAMKRRGD